MDWFLLYGMIGLALLILCFAAYSSLTNNIIKEQQKELQRQEAQIIRLEKKIKKIQYFYEQKGKE